MNRQSFMLSEIIVYCPYTGVRLRRLTICWFSEYVPDNIFGRPATFFGSCFACLSGVMPPFRPQALPLPDPTAPTVRIKVGIYVCRENHSTPSTPLALVSGRQAAEAIIADLKQ
jgi:hypothetical protein